MILIILKIMNDPKTDEPYNAELKCILVQHQQLQQQNFRILDETLGATLTQFGDGMQTAILDLKQTKSLKTLTKEIELK